MINRRTFIGSTIGGLTTCSGLVALSNSYTRGDISPDEGRIISYGFDFARIKVNKTDWIIPSQFPLKDQLIVEYDIGNNMRREETYNCWNWQLQGIPFDIGEFAKLPMLGTLTRTSGNLHKVYRDHKFQLCMVETFVDANFSINITAG